MTGRRTDKRRHDDVTAGYGIREEKHTLADVLSKD